MDETKQSRPGWNHLDTTCMWRRLRHLSHGYQKMKGLENLVHLTSHVITTGFIFFDRKHPLYNKIIRDLFEESLYFNVGGNENNPIYPLLSVRGTL